MTIWGKYLKTGVVEKVDSCSAREAGYLVAEYRMAFGRDWVLWAGKKSDDPTKEGGYPYATNR